MASTLLALLTQQQSVQTRKGLIITNLQNDFFENGKLPVSVPPGYFDKLKAFVSDFREFGDVIWVRSEYKDDRFVDANDDSGDMVILGSTFVPARSQQQTRDGEHDSKRPRVSLADSDPGEKTDEPANASDDDELFLQRTSKREACCLPGSHGAEFLPEAQTLIDMDRDIFITTTHYSAFSETPLIMTLRASLITELFICGGLSNLSVYATAMDAARHALRVTLVEDCVLARNGGRHDMAVKHLREAMEARVLPSKDAIEFLRNPPPPHSESEDEDESVYGEDDLIGQDPEVDDQLSENGDDDGLDIVPPRRESSSLYDYLQDLGFASPRLSRAAPGQAVGVTPVIEAAGPRGSAKSVTYGQFIENDENTSRCSQRSVQSGHPKDSGLTEVSLDRLAAGHASNKMSVSEWLRQNTQVTLQHGSSTHPGLQSLASVCNLSQETVDTYEGLMAEAKRVRSLDSRPLFGEGKESESCESRILFNLLPSTLAARVFDDLKAEITWQRMRHQTGEVPRLVSCQGSIDEDGNVPVYRHPSDQTLPTGPWTPTVDRIRELVQQTLGHTCNHVLIQLYRSGVDCISEHSDKTLDIVKDSYIVNVSFGAQRTMRLRTKRGQDSSDRSSVERITYRVHMPHNSMIKMSLATNAEYLHGINPDKRRLEELSEAEKAFEGQRISLTFRNIGTFVDHDMNYIWGQGATGKTRQQASRVTNAEPVESEKLVRAFGAENQSGSLQWDAIYGAGSNVLHLK